MAEIDFDELDKAVNSLMANAKKPAPQSASAKDDDKAAMAESVETSPASEQPKEQHENTEPESSSSEVSQSSDSVTTEPDSETESNAETQPESESEPEQVQRQGESDAAPASPKTPLATKRRGQFMDMKHSSADMLAASAPKPMSRVGTTLAPVSNDIKPEEKPVEQEPITTDEAVPTEVTSEPQQTDTPVTTPSDPRTNNDENNAKIEVAKDAEAAESDTGDSPSSPFLPGAKVEKRPLGAPEPSDDEHKAETPASDDIDGVQTTDDLSSQPSLTHATDEVPAPTTASVEPASISTTLPKELHSSVLEVEADTTATDTTHPEGAADNKSAETDSTATENTATETEKSDSTSKTATDTAPVQTSIPPQYKAKKLRDDDAHEPQASMYDAATDHPVLAQPKKTSHWAIVIVIIILILLGALGGAALYLYQTGTLSLV